MTVSTLIQKLVTQTLEHVITKQLEGVQVTPVAQAQPQVTPQVKPQVKPVMQAQPVMSEKTEEIFQDQEIKKEKEYAGKIIGQLLNMYIVIENSDGLLLIDQHAAHERLVYERFKAELNDGPVPAQKHLIPVVIDLPEEDCARLEDAAEALSQVGLGLERFGPAAVAVYETPALLGSSDVHKLVNDVADQLADWANISIVMERLEEIAARMACHGSVRSGRRLRAEEMNKLLREMEATPHSGQCKHGRPTYVELKLKDIERLFGRSG